MVRGAIAGSRLSTKINLACDAVGYPLGFVPTDANVSAFDQGKPLLKNHLNPTAPAIMEKGYDSDAIRSYVNQLGGSAVIPPKANHAAKAASDGDLDRKRHRIENLFAKPKSFRRIATRYDDKILHSFAAFVSLACIIIWLQYSAYLPDMP